MMPLAFNLSNCLTSENEPFCLPIELVPFRISSKMMNICDWEGTYDDLARYVDYPGDIVNTPLDLNGTPFSVTDGEKLFKRPVLGGLNRKKEIISGTTNDVKAVVQKAIADAPKGRIMIGAECTVSSAPIENIYTAIYTAHHANQE